jgi:hypothetical protein
VEEAQQKIVSIIRHLEETGDIVISRGEGDEWCSKEGPPWRKPSSVPGDCALTSKYILEGPDSGADQAAESAESLSPLEEYLGPTADDLRREAEAFKSNWEKKRRLCWPRPGRSGRDREESGGRGVRGSQAPHGSGPELKTKAEEGPKAAVNAAEIGYGNWKSRLKSAWAKWRKTPGRRASTKAAKTAIKRAKPKWSA